MVGISNAGCIGQQAVARTAVAASLVLRCPAHLALIQAFRPLLISNYHLSWNQLLH